MARKMQPAAITLDLGLSDIDGFVLLDLLRNEAETSGIPVHVISGGERADDAIALGADEVIEKPVERETLTQLFESIAAGKAKRRKAPAKPVSKKKSSHLKGKKILIIDDDIRNIYSLTSVLEAQGAKVRHAERGGEGIAILEREPDIDVALVDIMMPDMDGYETMRRIRSTDGIADIPLVAVTAKAMKGDRQKCLDAGANDYIAKPVDIDLLLALLRVWIDRTEMARTGGPGIRPAVVNA
jgi:CheY-like chemotaxis protein